MALQEEARKSIHAGRVWHPYKAIKDRPEFTANSISRCFPFISFQFILPITLQKLTIQILHMIYVHTHIFFSNIFFGVNLCYFCRYNLVESTAKSQFHVCIELRTTPLHDIHDPPLSLTHSPNTRTSLRWRFSLLILCKYVRKSGLNSRSLATDQVTSGGK